MVCKKSFDKKINGQQVYLFELKNQNGMRVEISNYGAKIISLYVPDKNGQLADVVLGFDTLDEWLAKETYFNAVIGRFANRIKDGNFVLDGRQYQLAINNGTNHLHGGNVGFNQKVWTVIEYNDSQVKLGYLSPDGEENYPGNLQTFVTYALTKDNALSIHYEATTDQPTIVGFTNHAYFNLNGIGASTIRDHILQVNADFYTPTDETQSPTGAILPVCNTPMDFRKSVRISDRIDDDFFALGRGIDNNWVLRKEQPRECSLAATLSAGERTMQVLTTMPGLQVYTGNWVEKNVGKNGKMYDVQNSICLEAQAFPNAPNVSHFPSAVLRPDEKYDEWCIYRFV